MEIRTGPFELSARQSQQASNVVALPTKLSVTRSSRNARASSSDRSTTSGTRYLSFKCQDGSVSTIEGTTFELYSMILASRTGDLNNVPTGALDGILNSSGLGEDDTKLIWEQVEAVLFPAGGTVQTLYGCISWQEAFVALHFLQERQGIDIEAFAQAYMVKLDWSRSSQDRTLRKRLTEEGVKPRSVPIEEGLISVDNLSITNSHTARKPIGLGLIGREDIPLGLEVVPSDVFSGLEASQPPAITEGWDLGQLQVAHTAYTNTSAEKEAIEITLVSELATHASATERAEKRLAQLCELLRPRGFSKLLVLKKHAPSNIRSAALAKALEEAVNEGSVLEVEAYVALGASADTRFAGGQTCVHIAAYQGNLELLKLLLHRFHAKPWLITDANESPMSFAIKAARNDALPILIAAGAHADSESILCATRTGNVDALSILLDAGGKPDCESVFAAVSSNNAEALARLLDWGTEIDERSIRKTISDQNVRLLELLIASKRAPVRRCLSDAFPAANSRIVELLVLGGAEVRDTHLCLAVRHGDRRMAELLVRHGATQDFNNSCLRDAVDSCNANCVQMLIEGGPPKNFTGCYSRGCREVDMAMKAVIEAGTTHPAHPHIFRLLLSWYTEHTDEPCSHIRPRDHLLAAIRKGKYPVVDILVRECKGSNLALESALSNALRHEQFEIADLIRMYIR
ncbi:MAG: hypothetical protein M1839_003705 [Geoglossum umbratile]|nr:MAG: hypothetical protein M1839_003705 [Geoglossum umbratile]